MAIDGPLLRSGKRAYVAEGLSEMARPSVAETRTAPKVGSTAKKNQTPTSRTNL
jgi:hypothetical protein